MPYETCLYSDGNRLPATICTPGNYLGRDKKFPAVVLCHGHSRDRNDGLDRMAEVMAENGFVTVRFDFRGNGEQAGRRYHLYCDSEMVDDIRNAISFAEALPFVDADRIGVAGISMGACMTVYICGLGDERIKSAVAMAPSDDLERLNREKFAERGLDFDALLRRIRDDAKIAAISGHSQLINRMDVMSPGVEAAEMGIVEYIENSAYNPYLSLDSFAALFRMKPIKYVENVSCPMFFVQGRDDEAISWQGSQRLYDKLSAKRADARIKIYEGVDHNIPQCAKREEVFSDIVKWFKETM